MRNCTTSETSLFGLVGQFGEEIKTLIRQEVELAKVELSEKMTRLARNAILLAIGGVAAFAGLIILLAGLSSLISYALENVGLHRSLAFFIGALVIGGGAALVGFGFLEKAMKTFSHESLAPEKTLESLKKLKGTQVAAKPVPAHSSPHPKRSSDEIEASIGATRREVGETVDEISERLTTHHMKQVVKRKVQAHPYRFSFIAAGTGLLSSLMIGRRLRHAKA